MKNEDGTKAECSGCTCGSGACCRGQSRWIWVLLAVVIVGALIAGRVAQKGRPPTPSATPPATAAASVEPGEATDVGPGTVAPGAAGEESLPRLVDLGATKCVPCKMMAPILEDLKRTCTGKLEVVFIDVWENPEAGRKHRINLIPTQIFYDASGNELFRHEGFLAREDIVAKWREFGVELEPRREAGNPEAATE